MISVPLFKREIKSNYKLAVIFLAVLTMYSAMIIAMFDPKMGESLDAMAQSMPELFSAFGMGNMGAELIEFIVNYLYGFLFIVFPSVFIILLSNRLMTRYIDRGAMAYLLATPNKRTKIAFTQALYMVLSILCLIVYVTALCIIVSEAFFPGELDISKFVLINVGLNGLLFFIGGICFLASCIFNDTKFSYGTGAGLIIAFILIQMVSQVGEKFDALKFITPLTLFNTEGLMLGKADSVLMFIILYAVGAVLFGAGIFAFSKRNLSL